MKIAPVVVAENKSHPVLHAIFGKNFENKSTNKLHVKQPPNL
jgi:hypothetical protein